MRLEEKAEKFARDSHKGMTRWDGYTPYDTHLEKVVKILKSFKIIKDEKLVAVGWLHDTVEDTPVKEHVIKKEFGDDIAKIVMELTHDDEQTDEEYYQSILGMSNEAKLVKLADLLANITDSSSRLSKHFISKRLTAISIIQIELKETGILE